MVVPVGCKKGVIGLAALLSAAGLSCSVLVNPESLVVRCDEDAEQDPCAEIDMQCIAGVCQARECGAEVCNGLDDDCNGADDFGVEGIQGLETDNDGDGYVECSPWVGTDANIRGGGDSNDIDPNVH